MAKNTPKYRQKLGMATPTAIERIYDEVLGEWKQAHTVKKLVVAYLRVSDKAQEDKYGLASQLADIQTYAAYKGYEISEVFVDVFTGTVDTRENLDRMKALLETGAVEEVLIYDIGRLARDLLASEKLYLEFRRHARVTSVTERFEDGIEGDLLRHIKQAFFHYDRAKMLQRLTSGKIQSVTKDGRWQGGFGLLGYRSIGDGQLEIIESEAAKVIPLFELLAEGMTKPQIAQELNRRGITTMTGKKWDNSSVANVITNQKFYSGEESIWAGVEVEKVSHEPILSAELVQRLEDALGRPKGMVTTAEAAKMAGVTVQTIHRWRKAGLLQIAPMKGEAKGRGRRAVYFFDPEQVKTMAPDQGGVKLVDRPKPAKSEKASPKVREDVVTPPGTLTVQQAADRLHTSASTVRRMMEQGDLEIVGTVFIKTSNAWLVSEAQVNAMPVREHSGRQSGYISGDEHHSKLYIPTHLTGKSGSRRAQAEAAPI